MDHQKSALGNFKVRTSWQAVVVVLGGLGLFGSQWVMPNSELFAHVKMKILASSAALAQFAGTEAPDVKWTDITGRQFSLSEFRGKRVVLNVFATWCGPCKLEIPAFNEFAQSVSSPDQDTDNTTHSGSDVIVIGLTAEDPETVREFLKQTEVKYPIGMVEEWPAPFDQIDVVPTTIIISPDGVIEKTHSGALTVNDLRLLLDEASKLNLKRPAETQTEPAKTKRTESNGATLAVHGVPARRSENQVDAHGIQ
jgi:thiol-disulfide isomerase/thioredoxin